jgi:hypothetical protein
VNDTSRLSIVIAKVLRHETPDEVKMREADHNPFNVSSGCNFLEMLRPAAKAHTLVA